MAKGDGEGSGTYLLASVPLRTAVEGSRVAIAILAVQAVDDVALGGLLIAAFTAPTVLAAPLVGAAVDRAKRPVLLVAAAALVVAIAFVVASGLGAIPPPVVAAVLAVAGLGSPVFLGALSSFAPDVVRRSSSRAFAVDALSYNIAGIGGPALVGVVAAAASSARTAMLVLAGVAVLGALALIPVRLASRAHRTSDGVLGDMGRGLRHLTTHRPLALSTLGGTASQLGAGALPVVAVAIALERGDSAEQASWLITAMAIGGLVGAGITALRPVPGRVDRVMAGGLAFTGVATLLAAVAPTVPLTAAALALSGLSTAPTVVALFRMRQEESPEGVRSQVFTVGAGLRVVTAAVGAGAVGLLAGLPAGVLAALIGLVWMLSAVPLLFAYRTGEEPGDRLTRIETPAARTD